jgi:hypothetical protein
MVPTKFFAFIVGGGRGESETRDEQERRQTQDLSNGQTKHDSSWREPNNRSILKSYKTKIGPTSKSGARGS